MTRHSDADYVVGVRGAYEVYPPITHPAFCRCSLCARHRQGEQWHKPFVIRHRRKSPYPFDRRESAVFALSFRNRKEAELRSAVEEAIESQMSPAGRRTFGDICDAYRDYLVKEGKRYDRHRFTIAKIETFFGRDRDPQSIVKSDYRRFREFLEKLNLKPATVLRHTTVLIAILNHAHREFDDFPQHQLTAIKRPRVRHVKRPITWTRAQVEVLLGSAMDQYEREQAQWNARFAKKNRRKSFRQASYVPLRGLCLIAYLTLMRPENNLTLKWEQISVDPKEDKGTFRLHEHKNSSKGVEVHAALHPRLVRYFRSIMPAASPSGYLHVNPGTGLPYTDIRKQWRRLVRIANKTLPHDQRLVGAATKFYTWRHTGASHLAEISNPVLIARMMGDTSLRTVMQHYFDTSLTHMGEVMEKWQPWIPGEVTDGAVAAENTSFPQIN